MPDSMTVSGRKLVSILSMVVVAWLALFTTPSSALEPTKSSKVILVVLPALSWSDVQHGVLPVLQERVPQSSVASMSVRTGDNPSSRLSSLATIGAGNRVSVGSDAYSPLFRVIVNGDATAQENTFAEINERPVNHREALQVGSLGSTLRDAGKHTAYVGLDNSGVVIIADGRGQVDQGAVPKNSELIPDAIRIASASSDVIGVDLSLMNDVANANHKNVASETDAILSRIFEISDTTNALVLITASTTVAPSASRDELGVFVAYQPNRNAGTWATSATTRRDGFVTLADVGPTVLNELGIKTPREMNGTGIVAGGHTSRRPVKDMVQQSERTDLRDRIVGPVSAMYVTTLTLVAIVVCLMAWTKRRPRWLKLVGLPGPDWLRVSFRSILALVLTLPSAAFIIAAFAFEGLGPFGATMVILGGGVILAVASVLSDRFLKLPFGASGCGLLWLVLFVDSILGSTLQLNSVFGYSPVVAGRFMGFGNVASAMFTASALGLAAVIVNLSKGRAAPEGSRVDRSLLAATAVLIVTLAVTAAPSLGSDVGGMLSLAPTIVVFVLLASGQRVSPKVIAFGVGAAIGVFLIATLADLMRPAESRTHLGRFVSRLFNGGGGAQVLERKLSSNLGLLFSSPWTLCIPLVVLGLGWAVIAPAAALERPYAKWSGLRAAAVSTVVAGVLGAALNDSGVAVPATMLCVVIPLVAGQLLEQHQRVDDVLDESDKVMAV